MAFGLVTIVWPRCSTRSSARGSTLFLRQLESSSSPLSIAHGEKKRLNLRVPDGR